MANTTTTIADLINPEVMADMIGAKLPSKIVVTPFAKIDTTLEGQAGNEITVPQYAYIGDAEDVAEGVECGTAKLTATTTKVKVKKAMKAVTLTDEAVLSGYGNPVGQTNTQLAQAIASKMDVDGMSALQTAQLKYTPATLATISYNGIVDAEDLFDEEVQSDKVMFINPAQKGALRKDPNFLAADKVASELLVTGAIGKVAGCEIVPSKKVPLNADKTGYICPIVKLDNDAESEDDAPALTVYMKRAVNVETERHTLARTTDISADELYTVALSNASKVVLASYKK